MFKGLGFKVSGLKLTVRVHEFGFLSLCEGFRIFAPPTRLARAPLRAASGGRSSSRGCWLVGAFFSRVRSAFSRSLGDESSLRERAEHLVLVHGGRAQELGQRRAEM